jgi:hypothetical protein
VREATFSIEHICPIRPLLRLVPASHARPPSIHVPAILFVFCPEFAAQSGLFIKENEKMYGEGNRCHASNRGWVGVPENHPQPTPPHRNAWITHDAHNPGVTPENESSRAWVGVKEE